MLGTRKNKHWIRVVYTFRFKGKLITWIVETLGWRFGFRRRIGRKPFVLKLYRVRNV